MKPCLILLSPVLFGALFCTLGQEAGSISDLRPSRHDLVHHGDILDVDVVGGFEFDWRGGLTPLGYLDGYDAYSEPIAAVCRSEAEIAADIERGLKKILREPKVVVKIVDRTNRAVARLEGAVRNPTRFSLRRRARLSELVVLAGGITDGASGDIAMMRQRNLACEMARSSGAADNGFYTTNIKISDLLKGKEEANPLIASGDVITVTRALPVYVIGAVDKPGALYLRDQTTVSRAVASAGGPARNGDETRVSIFRRDAAETRIIDVDLAKIKTGESVDEILKPFDIIDIAARTGVKRKYPPAAVTEENKERARSELPLRIID